MEIEVRALRPVAEKITDQKLTPLEKRSRLMTKYVERILKEKGLDGKKEKKIAKSIEGMSADEKAVTIYENMVACAKENWKKSNPHVISKIKLLWQDENARKVFLEKYSEARIDAKNFRSEGLGKKWKEIEDEIREIKQQLIILKQNLVLRKVTKPTDILAAKSEIQDLEKELEQLELERGKIMSLEGYEHTLESTDAVAIIMSETIARYHDEAKEGFVWLPSRKKVHDEIVRVMDHDGKAPLLIGPPGTGKTTQIDEVAIELTGESPVRIPCTSTLGEEELIAKRDFRAGEGAYDYHGCIAEAYTGFRHSQDGDPEHKTGRGAILDEVSQLNMDKALAPIKDILEKKAGEPLSRSVRKEVLPGAFLAATSNVPIADERLEREFGRVPVNYFEMTPENPELFEFMLAVLQRDDRSFPMISESALAPAYEKKVIPEDKRKTLQDGSIVVAEDELIQDQTDKKHGFLYRLSFAIRALQDAYIHGSKFNEKHLANTALYYDYDSNGKLIVKGYNPDLKSDVMAASPGGEMLKLTAGSSTLTAKIIFKWVEAFSGKGRDFVKWMQDMLRHHMGQTSPDDAEKIQIILDHFHIFDDSTTPAAKTKVWTPKEIGKLSPRVPRAVYTERPVLQNSDEAPATEQAKSTEVKKYETRQVALEDGTRVLIKVGDFNLSDGAFNLETNSLDSIAVTPGRKLCIQGRDLVFCGMIEDDKSQYNGQLVGKLADEDLYMVFDEEGLDTGIFVYESEELNKKIGQELPDLMKEYWNMECVNNLKNNPSKIGCPV